MAAEVTFLGTGDAFSAAGSFQASYLVRGAGTAVLLDCGASTLTSLKRHGLSGAESAFWNPAGLHGASAPQSIMFLS